MKQFDLQTTPLEGRNLIEASAGTGKTYTIARLFLRLLLEKGLKVDSILVVTFTDAATQELKDRIFHVLREALDLFESRNEALKTDFFFEGLLARLDRKQSAELLRAALRDFDRVSIHTIHGFCRRILFEHAFESGISFDAEVVTDQRDLMLEIAEDYWRKTFYTASPLLVAYALASKLGPDAFGDLFQFACGPVLPRVIPASCDVDTSSAEKAFGEWFLQLCNEWPDVRECVRQQLDSPALNKQRYSSRIVARLIESVDSFVSLSIPDPLLFKEFEKLTSELIVSSTKKECAAPEHPFFDLFSNLSRAAEALKKQFEARLLFVKSSFLLYANQELTSRKERLNILFFDDLLERVRSALSDPVRGVELIEVLRRIYRVALIDEFQDTDRVQYEIFDRLFAKGATLFLIGDPKQAIYSFRGADIFTYLHAAGRVENRFTLGTNYRSDEKLIGAVNKLFCSREHPFVFERIGYAAVAAGRRDDTQKIIIDGVTGSPFRLWVIDKSDDPGRKMLTKKAAQDIISQRVASEIADLLTRSNESRAFIGGKPLRPSHFAVLVRANREAELIKASLSICGVPSVISSNAGVFHTDEAQEVARVLSSAAEPNRPDLIRSALATSLFGLDSAAIAGLTCDEDSWDRWVTAFDRWHHQWQSRGFMVMFRSMIQEHGIRNRLVSLENGERRITNLLHLAELIHGYECKHQTGMQFVLKWLWEKVLDKSSQTPDEEMMRLESDDDAAKIVTIHKSKGLEYPIVFCPFNWGSSQVSRNRKKDPYLVHDPDTWEPLLALGAEAIEQLRPDFERETLAENMRLLYVATTRAKAGCYLVWGALSSGESSAASYLFHGNAIENPVVENLVSKVASLNSKTFMEEINHVAGAPGDTVTIQEISEPAVAQRWRSPEHDNSMVLEPRIFRGKIAEPWRVSSFTGLTHSRSAAEFPDHDAVAELSSRTPATAPPASGFQGMFAFPRGSQSGTLLHDILEKVDFATMAGQPDSSLIENCLQVHGFELHLAPAILELLKNLAATRPIPGSGFCFGELAPDRCLRELEFYFPLKKIGPSDLKQIFAATSVQTSLFDERISYTAEGLEFSPVQGFMKGYVDLIFSHDDKFYLLDWKSNFLGSSFEDYTNLRLQKAMHNSHYVLQYYLYLVALHKYLAMRIKGYSYELHFGGVAYVFLRGVGSPSAADSGVYFDRPSEGLIMALCELLVEPEGPYSYAGHDTGKWQQ